MKKNAQLIEEINDALTDLAWGSVEIYVQDNVVTQITVKNIKKTRVSPKNSKTLSENSKNKSQVLTNKKEKYINVYNN